jgi:hypothetical protein
MITLEIPETGRYLKLPEELAECDSRQYAEACLLIYRYQQDEISYEDFRVEMVYKLLDLKKGTRKEVGDSDELEMLSNIYGLSKFIDSFFEKDEEEEADEKIDKLKIKLYYIDNKVPKIKYFKPELIGPADEFDNITSGQYMDALEIFYMMEITPSKELMYELMAIFYRPKGKKYDRTKTNKYNNQIKNVHFGQVYGFYLLFSSFQTYLSSATVFYQGQELDLSILFQKPGEENKKEETKSQIPGLGMKSIYFQLAESGVFGPLKEVRKTDFWETILRLYDIRKRDLDAEADRQRQEEIAKSKNR